jgi:hypothetical protein
MLYKFKDIEFFKVISTPILIWYKADRKELKGELCKEIPAFVFCLLLHTCTTQRLPVIFVIKAHSIFSSKKSMFMKSLNSHINSMIFAPVPFTLV